MSGRYISSKLIKSVQLSGKNVAIEYVEKTSAWTRPSGFPSLSVQDDFVKVAQNNVSKFKEGTVKIAMKCVFELPPDVFRLDAYMEAGKPSIRATLIRSIIILPTESTLKATSLMSSTSISRVSGQKRVYFREILMKDRGVSHMIEYVYTFGVLNDARAGQLARPRVLRLTFVFNLLAGRSNYSYGFKHPISGKIVRSLGESLWNEFISMTASSCFFVVGCRILRLF